jgi:sortase A
MDVLKSAAEPVLTLVTCYPFGYIGPAPLRYVVRARLMRPGQDEEPANPL